MPERVLRHTKSIVDEVHGLRVSQWGAVKDIHSPPGLLGVAVDVCERSCSSPGLSSDSFPSPSNPTIEATGQVMVTHSCWCTQVKLTGNKGSVAVKPLHTVEPCSLFLDNVLLIQSVDNFPEKRRVAKASLLSSQWLFIQAAPHWWLWCWKVLPSPSICSKFPHAVSL